MKTREKLLLQAHRQFWSRGYSNVSVRQIAKAAGVDVALISRHFGSKLGLFEETLEKAFDLPVQWDCGHEGLVDTMVQVFIAAPRDSETPSAMRMLLANAQDDEVGELVREKFSTQFFSEVQRTIGDQKRATLFMAVLLGLSVAEKTLRLPGTDVSKGDEYEHQLRYLMNAALNYEQS